MPFLSLPSEAKKPFAEVLPDGRKRLTRYFETNTSSVVPPGLDFAVGTVDPWPQSQTPSGWTGLRLTYKKWEDSFAQKGLDTRPILQLIYEEISETGITRVGANVFTQLPSGRKQVVQDWVMFSTSTYTPETPGTSTAAGGLSNYYLWDEDTTNDGTLRYIKRTYQTAGTVFQEDTSLNGGKLLKRVIKTFKEAPVTPSGFVLVDQANENPDGYDIFTYTFYSADSGAGAGGEISRRYINTQGGDVEFNLTTPNLSEGAVRCIITYLTPISTTTDPTTGPTGFVRTGVDIEDKDGFRIWTVTYGFGNGTIINDVRGEPDGALVYTVQSYTSTATTPAYPGSGTAYLIDINNSQEDGFFKNVAVYKKPPPTVTFKKQINFTKPGNVVFTVSPPYQVIQTPPVTMQLLADAEVSYAPTQTTTTMFTVSSYATYYANWIPYANPGVSTTTGTVPTDATTAPPQQQNIAYGGYLGSGATVSGTNAYFNGVYCASFIATIVASTPSSFNVPDTKTLQVDNDPYLTATDGTQVYRRTIVRYAFP